MKYTPDYSCRFRILKGGKISLVVSALLVGSSLMGADFNLSSPENDFNTTRFPIGDDTNLRNLGSSGVPDRAIVEFGASITNRLDAYFSAFEVGTIDYFSTFWNDGTIDVNVSTANLASGMKFFSLANDGDTTTQSTVKNSGTIEIINNAMGALNTFRAAGITGGDAADSNVTNSGTITVSTGNVTGAGTQRSGDAVGINIGNLNNADIINEVTTGSITVTSGNATSTDTGAYSGKAIGIKALALSNGSRIENSGTMTVNGGNSVGVDDSQTDSAFGIFTAGVTGSSITNSGTLTVNGGDASCDSDTIDQGDVIGIYVDGVLASSIITNSGTLEVNGGDYILNSIITNGSASKGIFVRSVDADSVIRNTNSVAVESAGKAFGIEIYNSLYGNVFNNAGAEISATSTSSDAVGINSGSLLNNASVSNSGRIITTAEGDATGIDANGLSGTGNATITNSGTGSIITESTNGYAIGIKFGSTISTSSVINNNIITSTATNGIAIGIATDGEFEGSIENSKTIGVTAGGDMAVGIMATEMYDSSTITNTLGGNISVTSTGSGYSFGIYGSGEGTIINAGTITAKSDSLSIGIYESGSTTSTITNSGTVSGQNASGALFAQGFSFKGGSLSNTSLGKMYGNINASGTISNAGLISLPHQANGVDGTHPAASIGTFVNAATGTLEIGLRTLGDINSNTTYSKLSTTNATFENESTIKVNVLDSTNETLLIGETINDVVTANSILTIGEVLNITDNSTKLNFERVINDDNTIDLLVLQGQSYQERAAIGGADLGTQSAATALEAKGIDFVGVVDGDDVGFVNAVASTTPVATMAANTANTQIMNGLQGIVEMRQNNVMNGANSGDITMVDKNLWAKVYGSRGTQDNKNGINGFDVNAYGIGIGSDAEIAAKQRIGAAIFYTRAKVDVNNMNQNADLDVYTALVYGNIKMAANTDFLYQAGYSWQKTSSDRIDYYADRYTADFTAKVASLDLKIMQTYKMDNTLTLRPLIEMTYRHFTNPSYTENGAGTVGPSFTEEFTSTQLITSAGAIANYKLVNDSQMMASFRVGYDLHHDTQVVTSSYQGGYSFTTLGIDNGGWQYDIGLGYETANILGGEIDFMYNYQGQGSSFDNHVLSAKYVYKF